MNGDKVDVIVKLIQFSSFALKDDGSVEQAISAMLAKGGVDFSNAEIMR